MVTLSLDTGSASAAPGACLGAWPLMTGNEVRVSLDRGETDTYML